MTRLVMLAAGGTGGHLFPAESLAVALRALGCRVVLATDGRVETIARTFPADKVVPIAAGTPSGGSLLAKGKAAARLGLGVMQAFAALRAERPACVVGFGGYPTVPPLYAASVLRIPTVVHEQNAVIGRANRFLLPRAAAIATGFAEVKGLANVRAGQTYHTGNPVRPAVIEAASHPYEPPEPGGPFRVLVFGGSQGARVMSDMVPPALAALPVQDRARLRVEQQARAEDLDAVQAAYAAAAITAVVEPFFRDLPDRIARAHLVVSRSGASTVAELAAIGRPAILVPLPGAIDQDQLANARFLERIGAATVIVQSEFTPARLGSEMADRLADPSTLAAAASAAKRAGVTDAAARLAAVVLSLAGLAVPGVEGEGSGI